MESVEYGEDDLPSVAAGLIDEAVKQCGRPQAHYCFSLHDSALERHADSGRLGTLKYVKEGRAESNIADLQLEDEFDPTWYQKLVVDGKLFIKSLFAGIIYNTDGWKKRSTFSGSYALTEFFLTGRSAYDIFGFRSFWRYFLLQCKASEHFRFLEQP